MNSHRIQVYLGNKLLSSNFIRPEFPSQSNPYLPLGFFGSQYDTGGQTTRRRVGFRQIRGHSASLWMILDPKKWCVLEGSGKDNDGRLILGNCCWLEGWFGWWLSEWFIWFDGTNNLNRIKPIPCIWLSVNGYWLLFSYLWCGHDEAIKWGKEWSGCESVSAGEGIIIFMWIGNIIKRRSL